MVPPRPPPARPAPGLPSPRPLGIRAPGIRCLTSRGRRLLSPRKLPSRPCLAPHSHYPAPAPPPPGGPPGPLPALRLPVQPPPVCRRSGGLGVPGSSSTWLEAPLGEVSVLSPRARHKCRKSPRGKSVTRRYCSRARAFRVGSVRSAACAFWGLLAQLFPSETPGRLGVGNVGPGCSLGETWARPGRCVSPEPWVCAVLGPEGGRGRGSTRHPHALCQPVGLGVLPRLHPGLPPSPQEGHPTPHPTPPAAWPGPAAPLPPACLSHSVLGGPCHSWGQGWLGRKSAHARPPGGAVQGQAVLT
ncbi:uncharacterized protein [Canis lupus baileyi]|uniref:formin-like protein 5 n=1 Tax=Canis lupus familiaris TaxID=9615 RepID=UPI0018F36FBA|nr:formin-like protein 5 [Canis lupus familiaris]XP_038530776.1 formin-like protein 5 [Canis lupus familiaris]